MREIVIIGGGNIGSRHLQAIARLKEAVNISVVEPSEDAIKLSRERFQEIESFGIHNLVFFKEIDELPELIDIAIIATSSSVRRKVVDDLLAHSKVRFLILEKFMFTNKNDFVEVGHILSDKNVVAYADCARRAIGSYKELKEMLKEARYIDMSVTGGEWGLACNGIHMFDLHSFLTEIIDYSYDNVALDDNVYNSKRTGYIEFGGRISFRCKRGILSLTSYYGNSEPISISIQSDVLDATIFESKKLMIIEKRLQDGTAEIQQRTMDLLPTSEITTIMLEQLLTRGDCDLPKYAENAAIEMVMLDAFLDKKNRITGENNEVCLIT